MTRSITTLEEGKLVLPINYNDWVINYEPNGYVKFECQHKDYDGEGDKRIFHANTLEECRETIDERNQDYRTRLEYRAYQKMYGDIGNDPAKWATIESLSIDELFELS